ncbi:hypothetical protein AMK59_4415 [Oryctes borbonicus]|uniref:MICOS complex subunit MIC13 n=1 Tax=Oryctes borbonicus TaxID=1629725 RepID=A0A0T6B8U9_9SCAR|nr:hypothetical protein AMK59_4415 [Oryctes borbonicus]
MFKFAVKVGIAGGAVYYLADQGVWKDSKETTKLYEKINETLKPYMQEARAQIPIEIPELPSTNRVSYLTKQYWNQGVTATFRFLGDFPTYVSDWTSKGINAAKSNEEIKKFIDSFSSAPPPAAIAPQAPNEAAKPN